MELEQNLLGGYFFNQTPLISDCRLISVDIFLTGLDKDNTEDEGSRYGHVKIGLLCSLLSP